MSKIIFIPSEHHPGRKDHIVQGNLSLTINNLVVPVQHSLYTSIEPPAPASPFFEALNFLGGREITHITDLQINTRFWERADLIEWIEANCHRTVLVQAIQTAGEPGWRLGFALTSDHRRFTDWFQKGEYLGCFQFDVPEATYNEILVWVKDNVAGEAEIKRVGYGRQVGRVRMAVKIKEVLEIVAFKLRWYGEGTVA